MKRLMFGLAVCAAVGLCGWCPGLRGDEPAKDEKKSDPAKELAALQKEWAEAQQAFAKAVREAKTPEERQQVFQEKRPKPADFADRFLKIAEANPDSPESLQALAWLLNYGAGTPAGEKAGAKVSKLKEQLATIDDLDQLQKKLSMLPAHLFIDIAPKVAEKAKKNLDHPQAVPLLMWVCSVTLYSGGSPLGKLYDSTVDLLMERFPERKELAPLVNWLPIDQNPEWGEKHLRKLIEKTSDDNIKVNGKFGLATILKNKDVESQPEAEKLFESAIKDFSNDPAKSRLLQQAKNELAEMKGPFALGKPVPDIEGDDLDSKAFKLSDYKGKVVLLDFWGFW
jgi:hypothetical protein